MKQMLTFILICWSALAFSQQSPQLRVVDSLLKLGQSDKIIPYLESQLQGPARNEELLRLTGFYYIGKNDLEQGEKYYREALALNPKCARCYLNIGKIYARKNQFSEALDYFNKAIEFDPNDALSRTSRARVLDMKGDSVSALSDHNKAVALDAKNPDSYFQRGLYFSKHGALAAAVSDLTTVIKLWPESYDAYLNRATLNYQMGNLDACCPDYEMAKRLMLQAKVNDPALNKQIDQAIGDICDPAKTSYYYQRGIALYNQGKYPQALDVYNAALKSFPEHGLLLSYQGNALLGIGDYAKALISYEAVLRRKSGILTELKQNYRFENSSKQELDLMYQGTIAEVYLGIAEAQLYLGHFEPALTAVNQGLAIVPDMKNYPREKFLNLRGNIYLVQGKYELAKSDFSQAVVRNKDFALGYLNRAIAVLSLSEKLKTSNYAFNGRISKQPMNISWIIPGKAPKQTALLKEALADCDQAIQLAPESGFAYYIRGQVRNRIEPRTGQSDLLQAKKLGINVADNLLR
jgi:tetratricopeptide (TPR) repeat protein